MTVNKQIFRKGLLVIILMAVLGLNGTAFSVDVNLPAPKKDFMEMSIEELMEVPVVVSASRKEQNINMASVPISIIDSADIHYSGLTSLPEILQFDPAMDVVKFNRWVYSTGVRGLSDFLSDRVLLLIDGRPSDSPFFGGPEFYTFPVLLEDIDRVEIIRGPGGAAWGANAFSGAINVITKKPESIPGFFGSTTINEFGESYSHIRWAEKKDDWRWRVSVGYENAKSSEDVISGTARYKSFTGDPAVDALAGFDGYVARDFYRNTRINSEFINKISEDTELAFGIAHVSLEAGDFPQMGFFPRKDEAMEHIRAFMKLTHEFQNGSKGFVQWYGNFAHNNMPNYLDAKSADNGFNAQLDFEPFESHKMSAGFDLRWFKIRTGKYLDEQYSCDGEPYDEYQGGIFLIDRWEITDRLTLEGQIRGDNYSKTQMDWATRIAALYALDSEKNHILRLAAAKAYRSPYAALRKLYGSTVPAGGGLYVFNTDLPDDLHNEETYTLEAGYNGTLSKWCSVSVNTYFQRYEKLIGYNNIYDGFGLLHATATNIDGAKAMGGEAELEFHNEKGKLSLWYAYHDFRPDRIKQDVRANYPAKHSTGLTGRLFIAKDLVFNVNYKFTDVMFNQSQYSIGRTNRLDMTLSKQIAGGKGEVMIGVSDLLENVHAAEMTKFDAIATHELPGRTFFVRFQARF